MSHRIHLALLALLVVAPLARAGDTSYFYAMTEKGALYLNGTELQKLTGNYSPNDVLKPRGVQRWTDIFVRGSDRYNLRLDGRLEMNGQLLRELPFPKADYSWQRIEVDLAGGVHAIRSDGLLAVEGELPIQFDVEGFVFEDLAVLGPNVYAVRGDGAVYVNDQLEPIADFDGKKNDLKKKEGKGSFGDTHWFRLLADPMEGALISLRGDGQMQSLDLATLDVTVLPDLPFPKKSQNVKSGNLYVDFEISDMGVWYALRRDGSVYREGDVEEPLVNYPGKRKNPKKGETHVDLALDGTQFGSIRWDGKVYSGLSLDPLVELPKKRFVRLSVSDDPPNLPGSDNYSPVIAVYQVNTVEGEALTIPVIANDIDKREADLLVMVDELPDGATYDSVAREVQWPASMSSGKRKFRVTVGDESGDPPVSKRFTVVTRKASTSPKNALPKFSTIGTYQALVDIELKLPIIATDQDGDELTITPLLDEGAFALGATYDVATSTFCWTADFQDLGKTTATFMVSDGAKPQRMSVKLDAVNPLIFDGAAPAPGR